MSTRETAHGLASLGRNGDSVLVHMQPEEVSGLQALARANGTSLTINPHTGMPEAFNLGKSLGSLAKIALPIAAGWALGPGGFGLFESALGAGLAVGAGAYALTGDPMYALSSGLGGAGGFGLGQNLSAYGSKISEIPAMGAGKTLSTVNATDLFKTPGLDSVMGAADDVAAASTTGVKSLGPGIDYTKLSGQTMRMPSNEIANLGSSTPAASGFDNALTGIKGVFGSRPEGTMNYADFLKQGYLDPNTGKLVQPSLWQDVATVGMPVLSAMNQSQGPGLPKLPGTEPSNYKGPYVTQDREVRMPTAEETRQMREEGSPEFLYFQPSNPVPGYRRYAQGGSIQTGGIRDLYGSSDDQLRGMQLSQDGYGLGRLQAMYGGGAAQGYANGGQIPKLSEAAQKSYAVRPTEIANTAARSNSPYPYDLRKSAGYLPAYLADAFRDKYPGIENTDKFKTAVGPNYFEQQPTGPTMLDYIQLASRAQLNPSLPPSGVEQQYFNQINPQPLQIAQGYANGGEIAQVPGMGDSSYMQQVAPVTGVDAGITSVANPSLEGITNPIERASAMGLLGAGDTLYKDLPYLENLFPKTQADNSYLARITGGITGAGPGGNLNQPKPQPSASASDTTGINTLLSQAVRDPLGRGMAKGGYLDGAGDGMSDSIPATIEGKQPARLADGEFVIPADVVSHLGNGSTKAGAKVLYKMMNKVRKARTGNPKQGKQINPGKFVPV